MKHSASTPSSWSRPITLAISLVKKMLITLGKPFYTALLFLFSGSVYFGKWLSWVNTAIYAVRALAAIVLKSALALLSVLRAQTFMLFITPLHQKSTIISNKIQKVLEGGINTLASLLKRAFLFVNYLAEYLLQNVLAKRYLLRNFLVRLNTISVTHVKNLTQNVLKFRLRLPAPPGFGFQSVLKMPLGKLKFKVSRLHLMPSIRTPQLRIPWKIRLFFFSMASLGLLVSAFVWQVIYTDLPSPQQLTHRSVEMSTKIYDRNGILLYSIYKDKNRIPVTFSEIPNHVRLATLAAEDSEFYSHRGISVRGMGRAIVKYVTEKKVQGGSTITQQLVKNALLSPERTLTRKAKEIVLSLKTERYYDKDTILEMYLNEVPYGGTAYGIKQAAGMYFDKDISELTLSEAALLAGLPKSPTIYNPFGEHPELAIARRNEVLELMVENNFISQTLANEARSEKLIFAENKTEIKAPHFVMYVRDKLIEQYGEEMVSQGGFEVITTLDYDIQRITESAVREEVTKLSRLNVTNGAALVVDTKSGEILAMVGSTDYYNTEGGGNVNVLRRLRQPGSSIKVINYAYALSNGFTPASILQDEPITYHIAGSPPYTPRNYDGGYRGKLPLRSAFAESRNIPAVRLLASYGVDKMLALGSDMGITTWTDASRYGLSLTLGGGDVYLMDLAQVYETVAGYGVRRPLLSVRSIHNADGRPVNYSECDTSSPQTQLRLSLLDNTVSPVNAEGCSAEQVLDPRVAYLLIDILKDKAARTPAFGSTSALDVSGHPEVAVKTGTSNNLKDNVTVGFNQDYLVLTWVGNNNSEPMSRIASGITGAAPIWNKILTTLLSEIKPIAWTIPDGLAEIPVCSVTGTLPCAGCPTKVEWFLNENTPSQACTFETNIASEAKNTLERLLREEEDRRNGRGRNST